MKRTEFSDQSNPTADIVLTPEAQHYLRTAGKWAVFLGIMGFIGSAFILLGALFVGNTAEIIAKFRPSSPTYPNAIGGIGSLLYVIVAIFYFFLSLKLFQFGNHTKTGLLFADSLQINKGLRNVKSFFKLWGIATIIIIILFMVVVIAGVVIGIGWQM
jgi:hypothetical protein